MATYKQIEEQEAVPISVQEAHAYRIIGRISYYGGFDMAWDTADEERREQIFQAIISVLKT